MRAVTWYRFLISSDRRFFQEGRNSPAQVDADLKATGPTLTRTIIAGHASGLPAPVITYSRLLAC